MKTTGLLLAVAITALLAGCASTLTAVTDHDSSFDFGTVQSIAFLPLDRQVTSPTDISDMQERRVRDAFATELGNRGYRVIEDTSAADLLLTWHLVTEERTDVRTYNTMSAHYRSCWSCPRGWGGTQQQVSVRQFTQGTLIVDLLNPAEMQSVWRSIVEGRVRDNQDPEEAAARRTEAAQALFAEFPPL